MERIDYQLIQFTFFTKVFFLTLSVGGHDGWKGFGLKLEGQQLSPLQLLYSDRYFSQRRFIQTLEITLCIDQSLAFKGPDTNFFK